MKSFAPNNNKKVHISSNKALEGQTIRANKTDYLSLTCKIKNLNDSDSATFVWKKQSSEDQAASSDVGFNNVIEFDGVKKSDAGKYACVVKSGEDEEKQEYTSEWVEVRVDEYEPIALEIYESEDEDEIVLLCVNMRGKPTPTIQWLRDDDDDGQIDDDQGRVVSNEFGLELRLKQTHTSGIFKCVASNDLEKKIAFINTKNG